MKRMLHAVVGLPVLLAVLTPSSAAAPPRLARAAPQAVGINPWRLRLIDDVVKESLKRQRMPGAVVLIGKGGKIVYLKAFGNRQLKPTVVPMTTDTVFDLASLTKPIVTGTCIMKLLEQGRLKLTDKVAKHLPAFAANGKQDITIYDLLTHKSGLTPDNRLADYDDGRQKAMERIDALKPIAKPGSRFMYSDVGFIVLARIVKKISGQDVHEFSQGHFFKPLGMSETGFRPRKSLQGRAAPTEKRGGRWIKGAVHDPRAYRLGGIAGHAGLFSTAEDLAVFAQMILGKGTYRGVRVLDGRTVTRMGQTCVVPGGGLRTLGGWDKRTGFSSNRGDFFTGDAFGHGGFTGTTLWIDRGLDLSVIFLSNRVHPDGKGSINRLAGRIGTIASAAVESPPPGQLFPDGRERGTRSVRTGIDVLQDEKFRLLRGRRVGLITNHTGIDRRGRSTIEILHKAANVKLVALFSPEHGSQGRLDVARINDSRDDKTGLKIYSLYGKTRRPTTESLRGLDTLVFDIQDIGTRFYTYISTMGYAMQAAANAKLRFVVLDRPNPITGSNVAGPVLDAGSESFVGFHRLPVRHGMTVGELAGLFNAELKLGLDLHVVRLKGWERRDFFDATGLRWINPSPNMRNLNQALLYPGIGLLETTNLSVGRGTDTPFEIVGAPWIDGTRMAGGLNSSRLPGIRFVPVVFTPTASKYKGQRCGGVHLLITDRIRLRPIRTALTIARHLRGSYQGDWDVSQLNRLLANRRTRDAILRGKGLDAIEGLYRPELDTFLRRRQPFLLYK